jgi:acyl-homoserine-lactone acylase
LATIRYTEYGIPHITAEDYPDLGFGEGWAQAADQVCTLADGFVTVRGFTGGRCPDAHILLTYSQSSDPTSPHHSDQTELYSAGRTVPERFCEKDILASPALRVVHARQ